MRYTTRLRLKQLALVLEIHELGSLRSAATSMNMSQSAATKALQELEQTLGVPLFERARTGLVVTAAGRMFAHNAEAILRDAHATVQAAREFSEGSLGKVTVGALSASVMTLVPNTIVRLRQSRSKLEVQLIEGSAEGLLARLRNGTLDLVIGRLPDMKTGDNIEQEMLYEEPIVLVCRTKNPLTRICSPQLRDLLDQEWVLPEENTQVRTHLNNCFHRIGLTAPTPALITSSPMVRLAVLSSTDMIGVLTRSAARTASRMGLLTSLDIELTGGLAPIGLCSRRSAVRSPAVQIFIEYLRAAAKECALGETSDASDYLAFSLGAGTD